MTHAENKKTDITHKTSNVVETPWHNAWEQAGTAYDIARERARQARRRASDGIDSNPVIMLVGGLALGGFLAAILPKTQREKEWFGSYGQHLNDKVSQAASAAAQAGKAKLEELAKDLELVSPAPSSKA